MKAQGQVRGAASLDAASRGLTSLTGAIAAQRDLLLIRRLERCPASPRRAQTREQLLRAGHTLARTRGLGAASVGEIARAAGFTRGAFYSNFFDMADFLVAIAQEHHLDLLDQLEQGLSWSPEPAAGDAGCARAPFAATAEAILRLVPSSSESYFLRAELALHAARVPASSAAIAELAADYAQLLGEALGLVERENGLTPLVSPLEQANVILALVDHLSGQLLAGPQEGGAEVDGAGGTSCLATQVLQRGVPLLSALLAGMAKST